MRVDLRWVDGAIRLLTLVMWGAFGALLLYLIVRGVGAWDPRMVQEGGELQAALTGTLYLILLSVALALPVGVGAGIYLAVYARGRLRTFLSFLFELLASVPSILIGLFGFSLILALHRLLPGALPALWLAAVSVALLILPYLIKATELGILETPPEPVRLAYSLGASREQVLRFVQLPAARWHILKGILLATARAAEDTAVIMLTGAVASYGVPRSLLEPFEALPFYIYTTVASYGDAETLRTVFAAALMLIALASLWVVLAHWIERRIGRDTH